MGNPPFIGKKERTAEQSKETKAVFRERNGTGTLDYVCCWYELASRYMNPNTAAAFVSTSSITQGEQPGILWHEILGNRKQEIRFAHRTFPWESEARGKAHVHVVIIGFGYAGSTFTPTIHEYGPKGEHLGTAAVSSISPYLTEGSAICVINRTNPLNAPAAINYGSFALDDGKFTLSVDEYEDLVRRESGAAPYIKRFIGAKELLHSIERYCLWLIDADPSVLRQLPLVRERIDAVREWRKSRGRATTVKLANTPGIFAEIRQPRSEYCAIPTVSSERRDYIPIAYLPATTIASNQIYVLPDATLYHFGVLHSAMHMAWVKQVCGRLESRYRYSSKLVYNNYPWPEASEAQRHKVEQAAQGVLDARANHPDATLADLYDPLTMPADLAKAHAALDRAVDRCYRSAPFPDERRRFEHLFAMYEQLTAPLTATNIKSNRRV